VPSGATLGTMNGQASRIWVGVFNNGGRRCWASTIPQRNEHPCLGRDLARQRDRNYRKLDQPTGLVSASTLSSVVFRIIGYVEFDTGDRGTWATSPARCSCSGRGEAAGDIVSTAYFTQNVLVNFSSTTFAVLSGMAVSLQIPQRAM